MFQENYKKREFFYPNKNNTKLYVCQLCHIEKYLMVFLAYKEQDVSLKDEALNFNLRLFMLPKISAME
jgi:hypothetical protein